MTKTKIKHEKPMKKKIWAQNWNSTHVVICLPFLNTAIGPKKINKSLAILLGIPVKLVVNVKSKP